ncbi:hypothetical protein DN069_23700 [Streptacidiphilus pinicola]|uniref:Uncharacterized protein n=1 Tax=Streptacidiphilus pinicola TaxID=2219663 RepID=A0A2X0K7C3_9ACTN|nr:hypothetical protein [Streptacidiphilus pinicola]RAG83120.1 hypothetical protein DN069_23700 [Streptacidiphilus pinicola]
MPPSSPPVPCAGTLTLLHQYTGLSRQWSFYQSPASGPGAAPTPADTPTSAAHLTVNGSSAVCEETGAGRASLRWQQHGYELTLAVWPDGPSAACDLLAREAGSVR